MSQLIGGMADLWCLSPEFEGASNGNGAGPFLLLHFHPRFGELRPVYAAAFAQLPNLATAC